MLLLALLAALSSTASDAKTYTLEDLQALRQRGNFSELLEHLEDVAPGDRNNAWTLLARESLREGFKEVAPPAEAYRLEFFLERFMDRFAPQAKADAAFCFAVAKSTRQRLSEVRAMTYFEWGLPASPQPAQCQDVDLSQAVSQALRLPGERREAQVARRVAFGPCFEPLKAVIKDAINASADGQANACAEMLARDALGGITQKKCTRFVAERGSP